jgi:hypothetical protein
MVPRLRPGEMGDAEALILKAIEQKRSKGGPAYAAGKTLIVFLEAGAGIWFPNKAARQLPDPLLFATAWVVGLQGIAGGEYIYNVTALISPRAMLQRYLCALAIAHIKSRCTGEGGCQEIDDWLDQLCASFETAASRPPQDEGFLNAIKGLPHAEERPAGASRSTHRLAAALLSLH